MSALPPQPLLMDLTKEQARLILLSVILKQIFTGLSRWLSGKESAFQCRTWVGSLGGKDPLEKEMATHASILA